MAQIVLIEDDVDIRGLVADALAAQGHDVESAAAALEGLRLTVKGKPDLVVMDLGLPDLDGTELLRMIRAVSEVPIIVITARGADDVVVRTLDSGADDYLVKPFSVAQLEARVRALLRRGPATDSGDPLRVGELAIDPAAREATLAGEGLDLSPKEFDLLRVLAERAGEVVSKRALMAEVWREPYGGAERTVDVHLSWLRSKLGETARGAPLFAHSSRGWRQTGRSHRVRRRLALLSLATTALVVVALLIPLGLLVRQQAGDRARLEAERTAQSTAALLALTVSLNEDAAAIEAALGPLDPGTIVVLPDRSVLGEPMTGQGSLVASSIERQATISGVVEGGWEYALPVIGREGTAVVDIFVTDEALTEGVAAAWLLLALLGVMLVAIAVWVADRLGQRLVQPISELASTARQLGEGNLDARVSVSDPEEIREVGESFNWLAGRLEDLIADEREAAADLSHRLRTPLTSLRLQAEKLTDDDERAGVLGQVDRLEQAIDQVIVATRSASSDAVGVGDLSSVVSAALFVLGRSGRGTAQGNVDECR